MTDFRKLARNQDCLVRLPGCNGGGETTVLAHYRLADYCGTGLKPDDLGFGAHCCSECHDVIDGRTPRLQNLPREVIRLAHAEAVMRTVARLRSMGLLK